MDTISPKSSTPKPSGTAEPYSDSGYAKSYEEDKPVSQQHVDMCIDLSDKYGPKHNVNSTSEAPQGSAMCQGFHHDCLDACASGTKKTASVQTNSSLVTHEYSQTVPPVTKFKRIQVTPEQYDEDTQTKYTKTYESQTHTEHLGVDKSSET